MKEGRKIKQGVKIEDNDVWEMIDAIRKEPEYSKSLNKVFNDALKLGLPKLYDKLFPKEVKLEKSDGKIKSQQELEREEKLCEKFAEYVDSLREILINMIVSKNANCQIHEMLRKTFNDEHIENEKVLAGYYSETPKFLQDYEVAAMRNLHEK